MADANTDIDYYMCRVCRTGRMVAKVEMGFTSKLMVQELNATGIKVRLGLKEDNNMTLKPNI
jgi:DNA-directed RNA polymerase beta subunit